MRLAVIDDYQNAFKSLDVAAKLKDHDVKTFQAPAKDEQALIDMLKGFEAVVLIQQRTAMPRKVIEALPDLKLISQTGKNTAHIDMAAANERGIVVSAGGGGTPNATAEIAWSLILSCARNIPNEVQAMKEGKWQISLGTVLAGKALGVYAFGKIGSVVATVGKAFGMKVVCWGREGSLARAKEAGFEAAANREAFFSGCDVISLHIPLNKETTGIVKAADLALMKPDSILVNTSRAGLIEKGALVAALEAGRPGRAGIDVYETEPVLNADHPLMKLGNVVCTPHLGYVEKDTYEALYGAAVDQILAFAAGKPINVVKPA